MPDATVLGHQHRRPARSARPCPAADGSGHAPGAAADRPLQGHASRKQGFADDDRQRHHAARRRNRDPQVKLLVGAAARPRSPSTARPRACAPIRRSAAASTADRSTRRRSSAASHHAAAAQLRVPPGQGHGRPVRQRDLLHHRRRLAAHDHVHARRREQRRGLGPPDHDRHRAPRRHPGNPRCSRTRSPPSSAGPSGPALNIVTKSGTNALHGEALVLSRPGRLAGEDVLDQRLLPAVGRRPASRRHARRRSARWTSRTS